MKWERLKNCKRAVLFSIGWILFAAGGIWLLEEQKFGVIGVLMFIGGLIFIFKAHITMPNTPLLGNPNKEKIYKLVKVREGITKDDLWQIVIETISHKFDLEIVKKERGYLRTSWILTCRRSNSDISSEKYRSRIILKFKNNKWKNLRIKCECQIWQWPARRILSMTRSELVKTEKKWIEAYDPSLLEDIFSALMRRIGIVQELQKID